MSAVSVTIDATQARATLSGLQAAVGPQAAVQATAVAAQAVAVLVRRHLVDRNMASGGAFWGEAAESVRVEGASVLVPRQGVAWQYHGGRIEARPGRAMVIPRQPELKGVWPSELTQQGREMFVYRRAADRAKGDAGNAYLAEQDGEGIRLLYLLVKSVEKEEDHTVLPDAAAMQEAAVAAVASFVRRALARARETSHGRG